MCITSSRSLLDNTYLGAWDIQHPHYGYRHVLAYQNRVQNLEEGPNCMLLPIQSAQALEPAWLVDTSACPNFLTELYDVLDPPPSIEEDGYAWMSVGDDRVNYVVEQGVYHIAILNNLTSTALEETLAQIPTEKLPFISKELLGFFENHYKDFPLLLCCFNNKEAQQAAPILVHYPPMYPQKLMLNTLDSHGGIPRIDKMTGFHQKMVVGSYKNEQEEPQQPYQKITFNVYPQLQEFLPNYAFAVDLLYQFNAPNNDLLFSVEDLQEGSLPKVQLGLLQQPHRIVDLRTIHLHPNNITLRGHLDWGRF